MSTKRSFDEFKTGLTHLSRPVDMEIAPRETTPPPIQAPTAKEKKYDRQLRLWAASGQRALEESHVLLIVGDKVGSNSSVAGVETLKNLILPGIGNFTVADAAEVTDADLGVNFFLERSGLGKSRAEEATKLLSELNPDVKGHFISQPLLEWLVVEGSLRPFNLIVVCAPISNEYLDRLTRYALDSSIPLMYIHCVGFHSYFSIQLPPEFPIVDTHPDPDTIQDLRLLAPWEELINAVDSLGEFDQMTDHDHAHIPYLLILLQYLRIWRSGHSDTNPSTFKEKTEFRQLVSSGTRINGAEGPEENFEEACAAVLKCVNPPSVGSGCKEMFTMTACTDPTPVSSNFWLVAHSIYQFYQSHRVLPLSGSLPDMKATSSDYIKLQNIYKSKARADAAEVASTVRSLEQKFGRKTQVPDSEIEQFCKNASHVRVLTNTTKVTIPSLRIAAADEKVLGQLQSVLENYDTISPIFVAMNKPHIPKSKLETLLSETNDPESALAKAIEEFERCDGAELHNIASLTGGMVAQEAIKLLTRQYVPVDGTCLWDGIRSKIEIIKI